MDIDKRVVFDGLPALEAAVGRELRSDWLTVTQTMIDEFARVTRDEQWIHIDQDRARRESPFGTTVAHGFLTLSLLSGLLGDTVTIAGTRLTINYGFDRVRFVSPVPVGAAIRAVFAVERVNRTEDGASLAWNVTVEIRDSPKPALAALWLARLML